MENWFLFILLILLSLCKKQLFFVIYINHVQFQLGSTDKFLAVAKHLGSMITPSERRLYFRTASAHMASGCPFLALDVLARLPKNLTVMDSLSLLPIIDKLVRV